MFVDLKSHYNKIKRSKMDISNIYLKRKCFEIFAFKAELKLVDLEINKGINDGYLMVLHGSDVDLHVGEADQQDLEQQDLSNLVGRDRGLSCWL